MFADLGRCSNCGRDLRFVASHPNEGLCHPCWAQKYLVPAPQSDDEFYNDRQTLIAGVLYDNEMLEEA